MQFIVGDVKDSVENSGLYSYIAQLYRPCPIQNKANLLARNHCGIYLCYRIETSRLKWGFNSLNQSDTWNINTNMNININNPNKVVNGTLTLNMWYSHWISSHSEFGNICSTCSLNLNEAFFNNYTCFFYRVICSFFWGYPITASTLHMSLDQAEVTFHFVAHIRNTIYILLHLPS